MATVCSIIFIILAPIAFMTIGPGSVFLSKRRKIKGKGFFIWWENVKSNYFYYYGIGDK